MSVPRTRRVPYQGRGLRFVLRFPAFLILFSVLATEAALAQEQPPPRPQMITRVDVCSASRTSYWGSITRGGGGFPMSLASCSSSKT